MRTKRVSAIALIAGAMLTGCGGGALAPATNDTPSLIAYGSPTGVAHPEVVLIIMDVDDTPAYRCSGTLVSASRVLTAGHCTGTPGEFTGMRIVTESDVQRGNNNYPYAGPNSIEATAWHTHPHYTSAAFYVNDVGVIELSAAASVPAASYGRLPTPNQLNALKPSARATFSAVGCGLQRINPVFVVAEKGRMSATPHLIQINTGFTGASSLLLSNNARTGGTCFGDAGGPDLLGTSNVVAGVTFSGSTATAPGPAVSSAWIARM